MAPPRPDVFPTHHTAGLIPLPAWRSQAAHNVELEVWVARVGEGMTPQADLYVHWGLRDGWVVLF